MHATLLTTWPDFETDPAAMWLLQVTRHMHGMPLALQAVHGAQCHLALGPVTPEAGSYRGRTAVSVQQRGLSWHCTFSPAQAMPWPCGATCKRPCCHVTDALGPSHHLQRDVKPFLWHHSGFLATSYPVGAMCITTNPTQILFRLQHITHTSMDHHLHHLCLIEPNPTVLRLHRACLPSHSMHHSP